MRIDGACHCGNLSFVFETRRARAALAPRACDCGFCTRHAASCVSDPDGQATIVVREAAWLQRYRFGAATADFLLCRRCGVYLGATIARGDMLRATLNLRATALRELPAARVSYRGESREERIARRLARWTPAQLRINA
jgi:hypothetical protein